jgi:tetratricopeptide (TPR) repeat protein
MSFKLPPIFYMVLKKVKKHQKYILIGTTSVFAIIIFSVAHSFYVKSREENAHKALVDSLAYFNAPIGQEEEQDALDFTDKKTFSTHQEKWEKVTEVFNKAYKQNKNSGIAAMFLVFQSEGLLKQGKILEAIGVLKDAIKKINNDELEEFYKIKLSLLKIDSKDNYLEKEGLKELTEMAADESSVAHDSALYYLGDYYWAQKNFIESKNYWNQLLIKYGEDSDVPSPWAAQAKEKLRLIDSKTK